MDHTRIKGDLFYLDRPISPDYRLLVLLDAEPEPELYAGLVDTVEARVVAAEPR